MSRVQKIPSHSHKPFVVHFQHLLLFQRAAFFLFTMPFALTLEDGRNFLANDFSKTQLQVEIQKRQAAGSELPTHKTELRSKLSSLIKQELIGRGSHGSLPDWRRIDSLTVA